MVLLKFLNTQRYSKHWLEKVLKFLNQPISKNTSEMKLDEIIKYAIKNWQISEVSPLNSIEIS